jgi:hypothetical protein
MPPQVRTPVGDAPVIPLVLLGTGMYLSWFAIHYWRSDVKWPADPVKAILQGKPLPAATRTPTDAEAALGAQQEAQAGTAGNLGAAIATGAGSAAHDSNVNTGKMLAAGYGWGPGSTDWPYLYSGWQEESGWSATAANVPSDPYNHAYGIPQANPGTKMASAGPNWKTDAATQIRWGLSYIKGTYGAPSKVPGWSPNGPLPGYTGY